MDLTVAIVNYRGWDDLAECLASLAPLANDEAPRTEVVVADNASGDGRIEAFRQRFSWVEFRENSGNHGFAHGCNLAAENAQGERVLFLNPDARDPGGQVAALWRTMRDHPGCAIATARQLDDHGRPQKVFDAFPSAANVLGPVRALLRLVGGTRFADARRCQDDWREVDWVSGSALMIRREVLEALGGWSTDFWMYSEDVDLCRRARNAGHSVGFTANAELEHRHGGTSRRNLASAALTRSEVIMSKHRYARRNLGLLHRTAYHVLLMLARLPSLLLARLISVVWRSAPDAVQLRSMMLSQLLPYYRRALGRGWLSPRAVADRKTAP